MERLLESLVQADGSLSSFVLTEKLDAAVNVTVLDRLYDHLIRNHELSLRIRTKLREIYRRTPEKLTVAEIDKAESGVLTRVLKQRYVGLRVNTEWLMGHGGCFSSQVQNLES